MMMASLCNASSTLLIHSLWYGEPLTFWLIECVLRALVGLYISTDVRYQIHLCHQRGCPRSRHPCQIINYITSFVVAIAFQF